MEDFITGLVALIDLIYTACKIAMPFMIISICNKLDEIERKLK